MPERRIQILPDVVASQIAAGEVVERPASVAKELIENAFDAGARRVEVEFQGGGIKRLSVSDDGCGMSRDDALLSVERHATSKIRTAEDLVRIATLGFRGEALASIAAVSRFRLVTRTPEAETGTAIVITGGKLVEAGDAGAPPGTQVEVRDLFFNVPARRRFLRSPETEGGHIRLLFLTLALSRPEIAMTLRADQRLIYQFAPGGDLGFRLREAFGAAFVSLLRPVVWEGNGLRVTGFAGLPSAVRPDRSDQYLFVNGRAATAPILARAIREGYHTLLPSDRHPIVILDIRLPPEQVDVNVHPNKKEVRFRNPEAVREGVSQALRNALGVAASPASVPRSSPMATVPEGPPPRADGLPLADWPPPRSFVYPRMPMAPPAPSRTAPADAVPPAPGTSAGSSSGPSSEEGEGPWSWCRVLGQVGSLYVVLETEEGLALLDPHAAHERVLFERLKSALESGSLERQGLLAPEIVSLTPTRAVACRRLLPVLNRMGFTVSEFGGDVFAVEAVPALMASVSAARLIPDILAELEGGEGERGGRGRWDEERVIMAACRGAVKQRDRLTMAEIERLVSDLARTELPYTCPHGRPTMIFLSWQELDRRFGRSG